MTYKSTAAPGGVRIDGNPEAPAAGTLTWESVDGPQGGLSMVHRISTDIPGFASTSYYLDDSTPSETQCTGDAASIGASGPWVNQTLPNTDPRTTPSSTFTSTRTVYFEPPGAANGPARNDAVSSPFDVTVTSLP
jgi:hypothetical protein